MSSPSKPLLTLVQKIRLAFAVAAVLLTLRSVIAYRTSDEFRQTARAVENSHKVLKAHETLSRHLTEAENGERDYLITGEASYLSSYKTSLVSIPRDLVALHKLAAANPVQQGILLQLTPLITRKLKVLQDNIEARQTSSEEMTAENFEKNDDRALTAEIRNLMIAFETQEESQLEQQAGFIETIGRISTILLMIGTALGLLVVGTGTWLIIRDVTARRRAEEALAQERNLLHTLIETIPHQVYVKDLQSCYVLDNAAHRKYIGAKDAAAVVGKSAHDFFPAEFAAVYQESDQKVMKSGVPIIHQEEPSVDNEGNLLWLATTKAPLRDTAGRLIGVVCISDDITDFKHSAEKLRHFASQMERSNQELQEFASIASHDLQEPLRKILAFSHRLETKCGSTIGAEGLDYLARVNNAAQRMKTLINDLLTLSKVTSAKRPFEEVDLAKVTQGVISDLELQIEQTGASVEIGFLPVIEADPLQMRQLIQNLISNALKFRKPDQKPIVSISGRILKLSDYEIPGALPGADICQIVVNDNGIGFSSQYAEKIFAHFQRLHSKSQYEGSGIGLAVCRKITDRHGGSIMAKSSEGDGATFIVMLPVKQDQFHQ